MPDTNYVIDLGGRTLTRPEAQPAPFTAPARASGLDWARQPTGHTTVHPLTGAVVAPRAPSAPDVSCAGCGIVPDQFPGLREQWNSSPACPRCGYDHGHDDARRFDPIPDSRRGRMARDRLFAQEADELDYLDLANDDQVGAAVMEAEKRHLADVFDMAAAHDLERAEVDLSTPRSSPSAVAGVLDAWCAAHPTLVNRAAPALAL